MARIFIAAWLACTLLLAAGCVYEEPLGKEHRIPVDSSVLGLWEYVPGEGEKPGAPERMMVLQYSPTEYLVHYPTGKGGMYFRAYPIRVGDIPCVQLQLIGSEEGAVDKGKRELYHVAAYRLAGGGLEVRTLNTDLVDSRLKNTAALRAAFLQHRHSPELFANPGRFRRIEGNH